MQQTPMDQDQDDYQFTSGTSIILFHPPFVCWSLHLVSTTEAVLGISEVTGQRDRQSVRAASNGFSQHF